MNNNPNKIYTEPKTKPHYDPNQIELYTELEMPTIVPFVSEVEEFNDLMNKPNNYEPTIPERKEWEFVYNFVLEELEEYREACERGDIVEVLDALCDITYVSLGNGAMLHGLKDKVMAYWLAKVKVEEETSRGSARWTTEQFLVNAENATDAEVKLTQEYSSYTMEWHVDQLKQIKLVKVIE